MAILFHPYHAHFVQVHHGADALNGTGVTIVSRVGAHEAQWPSHAASAFLRRAIVARAPDIDHHQRGVVGAKLPLERGFEFWTGQHRLFAFHLLVSGHGGLHAGNMLPRNQSVFLQGNNGFVAGVRGVVK